MRLEIRRAGALALLSFAVVASSSLAARPPQANTASRFTVSDVMIPMRDGVRLHAKMFVPADQREPLPIVMKRTPYGVEGSAGNFNSYLKALADEGYIFVFQDIRGKYKSEGTFVMQRPPRSDPAAIDEGTDTFDTIDWLLKNVPNNNGRVGMLGISYDGWTTIMGAIEPHPALKAISPQASPADMWLGDDFHHNGAFRLSYGFEYAAMMESGKDVQQFSFDRYDTFDWYLSLGPLANVNRKYLHERIPTWNDYVNHPDYDEFWKRQTMIPRIQDVKVPTLNVAGWWDQEDFYGPVRIYAELEKHDTKRLNYLVVGPWNHGGWSRGRGETLGPIPFGSPTAEYFREQVQAPWFAYFLKDKGTLDLPDALTFEAGSNRWQRWDAWPPRQGVEKRALYFGLAGYQLMVSNEVFRGRYRRSFETPQPIEPNVVLEYAWSLHTQNYTFRKGHRIMVQVQSTWFPLIDRNPQTFVPSIFAAKPEDFKAATHRVYRTTAYPSRVEISVVTPR